MRSLSRLLTARAGVVAVAVAAGASGLAGPALAAASAPATGPASTTPASGTPALNITNTEQDIRQIVQCGSMMYAVGKFWSVSQNGVSYRRAGVMSFSATAPYGLSALDVEVNGEVNSIAFMGQNCADAYIGGSFTNVHGTGATNLAEISTSTGAVVPAFGRYANAPVDTLVGYGDHLLAGGLFTRTNGYGRNYYASLNPVTGKDDGFLRMLVYGSVPGDAEQIYNQQLSHGGNLLLVEGNFTSLAQQPRQQIAMLNLGTNPATLTRWTSPDFSQHCTAQEAFYLRSAAWSPSDSTVYIATTGFHPINWVSGSYPLYGICDAAAAYPATQGSVSHNWVEYSGCDSYYSVAADDGAVYVGGHPRWADNPNGCNNAGPGSVSDAGLQGLDPATGNVQLNSGGTALYSMSRANADSMLTTSAGLWIASTNRYGSDACDGVSGHSGICFLPYS